MHAQQPGLKSIAGVTRRCQVEVPRWQSPSLPNPTPYGLIVTSRHVNEHVLWLRSRVIATRYVAVVAVELQIIKNTYVANTYVAVDHGYYVRWSGVYDGPDHQKNRFFHMFFAY